MRELSLVLVALLLPARLAATELTLIGNAIFGLLSPTKVFDVNTDEAVSAADLTARARNPVTGSTGCDGPMPPEGELTIQVGPDLREYVVRLPVDYDNRTPRPLIFAYHGFSADTFYMESGTEIPERWPDAIGVYPRGLVRTIATFPGVMGKGWQLIPGEFNDRDVKFFDALLDRLQSDYCINPSRVYVTGHSNGAFFANVLGCERASVIAAIGPRSGALSMCTTDDQIPVIISHGMRDMIVPFFLGNATHNQWIKRNGCTADVAAYDDRCTINPDCDDSENVVFCPFDGGHLFDELFPQELIRFFEEHARV